MPISSCLLVSVVTTLLIPATQAQYLTTCAEHPFKVPITYWEPELNVDDWLASSAPTGDGRVVYIWAVFDSGDVGCELGGDDSLTLRDGEPLAGIDEPGESVHIRGGVVYDSGMCKVSMTLATGFSALMILRAAARSQSWAIEILLRTITSANSICSTRRSTSERSSSGPRVSPRSRRKSCYRGQGFKALADH